MRRLQGFAEWLDIFGFDKERAEEQEAILAKKKEEVKPIRLFSLHNMMDHLSRLSQFSLHPPFQRFISEIQWGTEAGSLRVKITPKYHVVIERLHFDLKGEPTWICKKVYGIDEKNYAGKEDIVAGEIYEVIQGLEREKLHSNLKEYDREKLALKLATIIENFKHDVFVFYSLKKLNESNYLISMEVKGAGVGRTVGATLSSAVKQYVMDISFNEDTGNIKIFFYPVSFQDEGGNAWEVLPATFFEFFSSTQTVNEIVDAVMVSLKCF